MDFILKMLRCFEFFSFGLANILVCVFFWQFLSGVPIIYFLIAAGISICVLKIQWVFLLTDKSKKNRWYSNSWNWNKLNLLKTLQKFSKFVSVKSFVIVIKQFVINTVYETFPVFLIWLGVFGISYLIGSFGGSANYSPNTYFFEIITSFGIILGVFQYYLKRHEDKIAIKITLFSKRISAIIHEELNFQRFYSSLDEIDGGHEIAQWINRNIDPKMRLFEILKPLTEDKEVRGLFLATIRRYGHNNQFIFQFSDTNSDNKFDELEMYALGDPMQKKLQKAYDAFFEDEQKTNEIIANIKEEIDIQEFGNLCLGNINILQEIFPQLINRKLKNAFENLYFSEADVNEKGPFLSFKKRREIFEGKITQKLMDEIMDYL
ncbi:MAG: hypothetical protein PHX30_06525 [Candidatus Pacebacteria bacterium]|nr:hypothetical protein [Candidatus Paceibacterota bacterium]